MHNNRFLSRIPTILVMMVGLLFCAFSPVQAQILSPENVFPVGPVPYRMAAGDLDGDGKLDLVTVNNYGTSISVLRGNGDGTFAPKVDYPAQYSSTHVALGDITGDGKLDIVVATSNGRGDIGLYFNNGDGTFAPRVDVSVDSDGYHIGVAIGDINGDGKKDIVIPNFRYNTNHASGLYILYNNGNNTFRLGSVEETWTHKYIFVTVGDVDGDNDLDILASAEGLAVYIYLFRNNGNGTFANRESLPLNDLAHPSAPNQVILGDVNGDGKPDILTANYVANAVNVLLNNGNGTFANGVEYPAGKGCSSLVLADVDGDSKPDVVTANGSADKTISVLRNLGNGVFSRNVEFPVSATPAWVATGDFNADGKPDFATSNYYPADLTKGSVSVLLNQFDPLLASIFGTVDRESLSPDAPLSAVPLTFRPTSGDPMVKTAYMKAKGAFWVQLPHDDYTLHLAAPKSLSHNEPVNAALSNVHDIAITLLSGDANGDNSVDVLDLDLLIRAFDASPTDANWNGGVADFNGDNSVDVLDLDILIRNFDAVGDE